MHLYFLHAGQLMLRGEYFSPGSRRGDKKEQSSLRDCGPGSDHDVRVYLVSTTHLLFLSEAENLSSRGASRDDDYGVHCDVKHQQQ